MRRPVPGVGSMKFIWAVAFTLVSTVISPYFQSGSYAESADRVTDFDPVSVGEASYIDLMDEINRLMEVKPEDIAESKEAVKVFARFENMVRGLVKINDLETAGKLTDHARRLYGDQMRSAFLAGWVQGLMGNREEAVDLLLAGLGEKSDILPDPDSSTQGEIKTTLAGFLIEMGNPEKAVEYLKEITEGEETGALVHDLAGLAYHQIGDAYYCSKSYKEALQIDESLASANDYLVYAWAEDQLNRPKRVDSVLNKGIEQFPMEAGLYFNRAANHEILGSSREAFHDYQMEILVGGLASAFSEEARSRINKIISIQSKLPSPDKELMNVAYYMKAKEQISKVDPSLLEDVDTFKKQEERMDSLLNKAMEGNKNHHPFLVYLKAERLMEMEKFQESIDLLEATVEKYPGQVLFEIQLAQSYAKVDKTQESEELIKKAQLAAPNHWIVRDTLGPTASTLGAGY